MRRMGERRRYIGKIDQRGIVKRRTEQKIDCEEEKSIGKRKRERRREEEKRRRV